MQLRGVTGCATDGVLTEEQQRSRDLKQLEIARKVLDYWANHGLTQPYPAVVMPTGFGKSHVIRHILSEIFQRYGAARVLDIVGTKNVLLNQSLEALGALVTDVMGDERFTLLPDVSGQVTLGTWQGVLAYQRSGYENPNFDLGVVDELHNTGTENRIKALAKLGAKHVVGLTATAFRSHGAFRAPEEYGFKVVESMGLPECINNGWNSPMLGLAIDTEVILPAEVREGGSLNGKKLYRALRNHPQLFQSIAQDIATRFLPEGMKTVIAVNRVKEEACVIARELMRLGYKVGLAVNEQAAKALEGEFVTHDTLRRSKLPRDHPDWIQVVISPQVIGEGYDDPTIECIIWAAPTLSSLRYTQVIGRGSRLCPYKAYCLVVDYVYMIENYGYSLNFGQFFRKDELKELEGGYVYLGPQQRQVAHLPDRFTRLGKVVSLLDLHAKQFCVKGDWLTLTQLADAVRGETKTVRVHLSRPGMPSGEERRTLTGVIVCYPPETLELLRALPEYSAPDPGDWLNLYQLTRRLQRSRKWVESHVSRPGMPKGESRRGASGVSMCYPPTVVELLKALPEYAMAEKGSWLTLEDLAVKVSRSTLWIERRLSEPDMPEGEDRRTLSGVTKCYPPHIVECLKALPEYAVAEAGDWLTIDNIAAEIGRSAPWVTSRLALDGMPKGEDRRTGGGRLTKCYPPEAVLRLKCLPEILAKEQGDWLTLNQLAKALKKGAVWIRPRWRDCWVPAPEERWTSRGLVLCYPPEAIALLMALPEYDVPEQGDWLTLAQLISVARISRRRVKAGLSQLGIAGEVRKTLNGNTITCYPPETVDLLKSL